MPDQHGGADFRSVAFAEELRLAEKDASDRDAIPAAD
jgi:hypothetical protein